MRIVTNEKLIRTRARIGQVTSLAGMVILVGGMYLTFTRPDLGWFSLVAFLVGFILTQVGIYFGNKFVRVPRADKLLNTSLKGLDKRNALYHFKAPTTHLLVGPVGIWAFFPKYQRGTITYSKNRWRQRGKGPLGMLWLGYLSLFAQEGLGRPDIEMSVEVEDLQRYLQKHLPEGTPIPPIQPLLVFTSPDAVLDAANAPIPTLRMLDVKDHIRKNQKQTKITPELAATIQALFDDPKETEIQED